MEIKTILSIPKTISMAVKDKRLSQLSTEKKISNILAPNGFGIILTDAVFTSQNSPSLLRNRPISYENGWPTDPLRV